jgi:hypothetical protein
MRRSLAFIVAAACSRSEPVPLATGSGHPDQAPHATASLETIPAVYVAGFLSGAYHTNSNIPVVYADLDKKRYVMMGKHAQAELPFTAKPDEADRAFTAFFVANDYAIGGEEPTDRHPKVMIDGKEMVVVGMDELLPTMPDDLKARFTPAQLELLRGVATNAGYRVLGKRVPLVYCSGYKASASITYVDAKSEHEYQLTEARPAFAALRAAAQ